MRSIAMGLGVIAGAAITLTVVNNMYPDLPRRMTRDGRRVVRQAKRAFSGIGQMLDR